MAQYFSPLKLHNPLFHCPIRGHRVLLRVLRCQEAALSGKRLELGTSQHQETWWPGVCCPQGPPALDPIRDSGPSQNVADNRALKRVNLRALCQAGWTPPQSSKETEGSSASRDGKASHVREAGDNRVGTTFFFLFFNILPMLPYSIVDLQCCDCCQGTATWFRQDVSMECICPFSDSFAIELIAEG